MIVILVIFIKLSMIMMSLPHITISTICFTATSPLPCTGVAVVGLRGRAGVGARRP